MNDIVKVLEDALEQHANAVYMFTEENGTLEDVAQAKQTILQAIDTLVDEVIGYSDLAVANMPGLSNDNMARNGLRNEQRQRLAALLKGDRELNQ